MSVAGINLANLSIRDRSPASGLRMVEMKVANHEDAWQGLGRQLEPHPRSDTGGGGGGCL